MRIKTYYDIGIAAHGSGKTTVAIAFWENRQREEVVFIRRICTTAISRTCRWTIATRNFVILTRSTTNLLANHLKKPKRGRPVELRLRLSHAHADVGDDSDSSQPIVIVEGSNLCRPRLLEQMDIKVFVDI